jgi:hypothetical protein
VLDIGKRRAQRVLTRLRARKEQARKRACSTRTLSTTCHKHPPTHHPLPPRR